jgi:outer membrane protein insertion porin family
VYFTKLKFSLLILFISTSLNIAESGSIIKKILPTISVKKTSQTPSATSTNTKIPTKKTVTVKGNKTISSDTIITNSQLSNITNLNEFSFKRAKQNILNSGIYKNVNIELNKTDDSITIFVEENPEITDIIFKGNTTYTKAYLDDKIKSKPKSPLNLNNLRHDLDVIKNLYKKDGFFEAKIFNIQKPENKNGPLIFNIAEGELEDIIITGNTRTKSYVILREMQTRPGDILNTNTLRSDLRKIYNLNFFTEIIPEFLPSETPHKFILKLSIKERETSGAFTFGGGYSPQQGFNIFSDLYWDNLLGTARVIMLKGNLGLGTTSDSETNNTYQIKYSDPWAFGPNRSFTFRLWSRFGAFRSFNLLTTEYGFKESIRKGTDIEIGIPHTYDLRTSHKVKYENVELPDDDIDYNLYTYTFSTFYDIRDEKMNPTKGVFHNFSIEQGFKLSSAALDLTRININLRKYIPAFKKQVVYLKSTLGYITSSEIDNENIFIDEYYVVGNSRTVRGYSENSPFGYGNKQVILTAEYRYIFNTSVTAYLFTDVGYASKFRQSDNTFESKSIYDLSEYKLTKGIGVKFIIAPVGPIKLDFGITDTGVSRLQFNMGYTF